MAEILRTSTEVHEPLPSYRSSITRNIKRHFIFHRGKSFPLTSCRIHTGTVFCDGRMYQERQYNRDSHPVFNALHAFKNIYLVSIVKKQMPACTVSLSCVPLAITSGIFPLYSSTNLQLMQIFIIILITSIETHAERII